MENVASVFTFLGLRKENHFSLAMIVQMMRVSQLREDLFVWRGLVYSYGVVLWRGLRLGRVCGESVIGWRVTHTSHRHLVRPLRQDPDGVGVPGGGEGDPDHPVRQVRDTPHTVQADLGAVA